MSKSVRAIASNHEDGEFIPAPGAPALALLKRLWIYNPDLSQYVTNITNLGNSGHLSDFRSTLTGALAISQGNGAHLYELETQSAAQAHVLAPYYALDNNLLPYNHLPFEALFITPLVLLGLPYSLIFLFWTLIMVLALGLSLLIMHKTRPIPRQAILLFVLDALLATSIT